ncbi:MAG TPA: hypothetical protein VLM89_11995 [Phycisphaerae bacterium]|nr:hypothetical protein [Phycisphaerae bacterium]
MPSGRGAARGASAPMVGGTVFLGAGTSATELLDPNFRSPSFKLLVGVESLVKSGYNPAIPGTRVGLALAQSRFSSWGPPEVISKRSTYALPHTQPADGEAAAVAAPRMAMQDLVRNRLDARREVYEHRARQAFKAADYHEACDQLALADATVMHDPERRLQMKLWFVYAAIAGEQFEEAAKTLEWILMRDPSQGASVVAVLNQYRDIAPLYGNPQDMIDHATALELYASRTRARSTPASGALRAIMAWGRADPANAKYHARQLADEIRKALQADRTRENDPRTTCWLRLYDYMQLTEGGEQPVLKQEEPREAGKRPMRAEPGSLTLRALSLPSP